VLAAARELLAEGGLEAVTMRGLATRLGVTPNALYSHVASKTALIDAMLDDLLDQVQAPDPERVAPADGLRALMTSTYDVLLAHPDMLPLYLARRGSTGPNAQRLGVVMFALLARGGVEGPRARDALRVLIVYTIGFAAFSAGTPIAVDDRLEPPLDELAATFESGLRSLLRGVGVPEAP
jgi:TetR/AcrR family tetracycline transcriptional repressor